MSITKVKPKQIDVVTTIGDPGVDTNIPTEKAVRDALDAAPGGGDVYGDAAATDEHLAVFDADGYHIKDGGVVPTGGGDVLGPVANDDGYIPQWDGNDSKTLKNGLLLTTSIADPGVDTSIPTEKAVRDALDAVPGGGDVLGPVANTDNYIPQWDGADSKTLKDGLAVAITVGDPGVDTSIPTEKAVRDALDLLPSGDMFLCVVIHDVPTDVYVTQNINNTSYVGTAVRCFYIDFDVVSWTHFAIQTYGHSNAAGQTVTLQLSDDVGGFPALSAAGNDLVLSNTSQWWQTGWVAISGAWTGIHRLIIAIKGSNSTVDYEFNHLSLMFKKV
ncbi:MAG: hypothetical protein V1775_02170 [Bacteroidota bacterium]